MAYNQAYIDDDLPDLIDEEDVPELLIPENWDIEIALDPEPPFFMKAEDAHLVIP